MPFVRKFYTADLHLAHAAIIPSTGRPFAAPEEMDVALVERINERCGPKDMLYILGDFTLSRNEHYVRHLFHAIRPRKVLVIGNHDVDGKGRLKPVIAGLPWDIPPVHALETNDGPDGARVWLSHYGHRRWPASHHGTFHFYGHSHGRLPMLGRSRDVGVDCPDAGFGPLTFEQLTEGME